MKNRSWKIDGAVFLAILAAVLLQVIRCGDLPGLYLDAVNPDYAAVQLRWPELDNEKWMVAWPWLCQVYHGNLTIVPALISLLITGKTSVLQMHIVNGIMLSICLILVYVIMKRMACGLGACLVVMAFAVSMPTMLTITMTQYYIELPASILTLCSMLCMLEWKTSRKRLSLLYLGYFLLGLAFYGYFNFLFFLPGWIIYTILNCGENRIAVLIKSMISFSLGCCCYFIGYTQIALNRLLQGRLILVLGGVLAFATVFFCTLLGLWFAFSQATRKIRVCTFGAVLAVLCIWTVFVLPHVADMAKGLQIQGVQAGVLARIRFLMQYLYEILSGISAERLIYRIPITRGTVIPLWFLVILTGACIVKYLYKKEGKNEWLKMLGLLGIYGFCCLMFASRMQPQHLVPIVFCILILMGLELKCLWGGTRFSLKGFNGLYGICVVGIFLITALNVLNTNKVILKIEETGGLRRYSSQINELAYRAEQNLAENKQELYVFKDWGFLFGFNYLTKNQVQTITSWDTERMREYLNWGYDLVICSWEKDTDDEAVALLKAIDDTAQIERESWLEKNGDIAFYSTRLMREE